MRPVNTLAIKGSTTRAEGDIQIDMVSKEPVWVAEAMVTSRLTPIILIEVTLSSNGR
jgi:hypothetical protein